MTHHSFRVCGKWILAGEHAVVRHFPALVFPLKSRALQLEAKAESASQFGLTIKSADLALQSAAQSAMQKAITLFPELPSVHLTLTLDSTIPVGSGLGSSAALSVAVSRLWQALGLLAREQEFKLALELENIFHGTSSGIDLAAVAAGIPIQFERDLPSQSLALAWKPNFYLLDSGLRSSTKVCVEKVVALHRPDIDEQMALSVRLARVALESQESHGLPLLVEAITLAQACFRSWDLIPPTVENKISELYKAGALACKLTGSGAGGFILCLWPSTKKAPPHLIPCLQN